MDNQKGISKPQWYVIHTLPKQEDRAEANLIAWGIDTFNPKIKVRRCNRFTGHPTYLSKPLFSRYIFARFDAAKMIGKINFTKGVQSVVTFGNCPAMVDDEIIQLLRSQVGSDNFMRLPVGFKCGDAVQIKNGAFKSLTGIFERDLRSSQRVLLLLTAVNYQGHLVVERELLEKIS